MSANSISRPDSITISFHRLEASADMDVSNVVATNRASVAIHCVQHKGATV